MTKKISISLYSPYHDTTLRIEDLDWVKDTLDVVIFGISQQWNVPKHSPTLWQGRKELKETNISLKDLGIVDNEWLGVGWRANDPYDHFLINKC